MKPLNEGLIHLLENETLSWIFAMCFTPDIPPCRNVNMADRKAPQFNYNAMNPWRYMEIYGAGPHSLTYGRRSLPKENTKALKWEWSQLPSNHMFTLSSRQRSLDPSIPSIRMLSLCCCKHSHTWDSLISHAGLALACSEPIRCLLISRLVLHLHCNCA